MQITLNIIYSKCINENTIVNNKLDIRLETLQIFVY